MGKKKVKQPFSNCDDDKSQDQSNQAHGLLDAGSPVSAVDTDVVSPSPTPSDLVVVSDESGAETSQCDVERNIGITTHGRPPPIQTHRVQGWAGGGSSEGSLSPEMSNVATPPPRPLQMPNLQVPQPNPPVKLLDNSEEANNSSKDVNVRATVPLEQKSGDVTPRQVISSNTLLSRGVRRNPSSPCFFTNDPFMMSRAHSNIVHVSDDEEALLCKKDDEREEEFEDGTASTRLLRRSRSVGRDEMGLLVRTDSPESGSGRSPLPPLSGRTPHTPYAATPLLSARRRGANPCAPEAAPPSAIAQHAAISSRGLATSVEGRGNIRNFHYRIGSNGKKNSTTRRLGGGGALEARSPSPANGVGGARPRPLAAAAVALAAVWTVVKVSIWRVLRAFYNLIQLLSFGRKSFVAKNAVKTATSWREWYAVARERDIREGFREWSAAVDDSESLFDGQGMGAFIESVQNVTADVGDFSSAEEREHAVAVRRLELLRVFINRNTFGITHPALYNKYASGTKQIIREYIEVCGSIVEDSVAKANTLSLILNKHQEEAAHTHASRLSTSTYEGTAGRLGDPQKFGCINTKNNKIVSAGDGGGGGSSSKNASASSFSAVLSPPPEPGNHEKSQTEASFAFEPSSPASYMNEGEQFLPPHQLTAYLTALQSQSSHQDVAAVIAAFLKSDQQQQQHATKRDTEADLNDGESCGVQRPPLAKQKDILRLLVHSSKLYGSTALLLSGSIALGAYHLGVVKGLIETKCLPRVIFGSNTGAIVAAYLCCHGPQDYNPADLNYSAFSAQTAAAAAAAASGGKGAGSSLKRRLQRFWREGYLMDVDILQQFVKDNIGEMTFMEAYKKTGLVLNIQIINDDFSGEPPSIWLLNYLSTPNVLIYSAAARSCATRGFYKEVNILCRSGNGEICHFDLPAYAFSSVRHLKYSKSFTPVHAAVERMRQLFNIKMFIVCECSVKRLPFLRLGHRDGLIPQICHFFAEEFWRATAALSRSAPFKGRWTNVLQAMSSNYPEPHILLQPITSLSDVMMLMRSPDAQWLRECERRSSGKLWPRIVEIATHVRLEAVLQRAIVDCVTANPSLKEALASYNNLWEPHG